MSKKKDKLDVLIGRLKALVETAAPITTKKRNRLQDQTFAFPKQRKMPLDSPGRVRNAMARFNQVTDVTDSERRSAYRKILSAAKKLGIDASGFKDKYGPKYS